MLLGAFGASAVLIYGAYKEPFAQPRNVLLGHFLAACIGVTVNDFFGVTFWSIALGVSLALVLMVVTYSIHPLQVRLHTWQFRREVWVLVICIF